MADGQFNDKGKSQRVLSVASQLTSVWDDFIETNKLQSSDLEQVKRLANKTVEVLSSNDKSRRDILLKQPSFVNTLFSMVEYFHLIDQRVSVNALDSLVHLATAARGGCLLINTTIIFRCLSSCSSNIASLPHNSYTEDMLTSLHNCLLKIAAKDRKIVTVARLSRVVHSTIQMFEVFHTNHKLNMAVLQVLKLYATSTVNCNIMIKSDVISIVLKIILSCGVKYPLMRHCLELLITLCKTEKGAHQAVKFGVIPHMLDMYRCLQTTSGKNKNLTLRKSILLLIKSCLIFKFGRKSFNTANGFHLLYFLGLEVIDRVEFNGIFRVLVSVLQQSMLTKLPLNTTKSVLEFPLHRYHDTSEENEGSSDNELSSGDSESCHNNDILTSASSVPRGATYDMRDYGGFFPELDPDTFHSRSDSMVYVPTATSMCNYFDTMQITERESLTMQASDHHHLTSDISNHRHNFIHHNLSDSCITTKQIYRECPPRSVKRQNACHIASFKSAPVLAPHHDAPLSETLLQKTQFIHRFAVFEDFKRHIFPDTVASRTVFDLDALVHGQEISVSQTKPTSKKPASHSLHLDSTVLSKMKVLKRGLPSVSSILSQESLSFKSQFESGNLRKAVQVRLNEYDLFLNADINTDHHHQWFFFQVTNMKANVSYRLNIVNCEKPNSQFNFGMQPLMYSDRLAEEGRPGWRRCGTDVCYYKNVYLKDTGKRYYTVTFNVKFPFSSDTCYLAYHYPYTYTHLISYIHRKELSLSPRIFYKHQTLCETLAGNAVSLLTITGCGGRAEVEERAYVVLSARVHPGETNSSWVMEGVLASLMSDSESSNELRSKYVFKVIPMLNPDGVIHGSHRCSLSGQDLNRQWKEPDPSLHPTIYYAKALLKYLQSIDKRPEFFVDFHGHSRKKNVFMYGCKETGGDVTATPVEKSDETSTAKDVELFPRLLSQTASCFNLNECNYAIEKSKESTARVVVFREFGVINCYTMESTYCGIDHGIYRGFQITPNELLEIGEDFCTSLLRYLKL